MTHDSTTRAARRMLRRELEIVMRQAGTPSLARVNQTYVVDRGRW